MVGLLICIYTSSSFASQPWLFLLLDDETPVPPTAPSGLTVNTPTTSTLNLNWTDASNNENGFSIFMSTTQFGTYLYIDSVSANTTTYLASGLTPSTTYWFKVTAYNTVGESDFSNSAYATTETSTTTTTTQPTTTTTSTTTTTLPPTTTTTTSTTTTTTTQPTTTTTSTTTTTLPPTTTTFYPSIDNLVMVNSENSSVANTAYPSGELAVGCNWGYISYQSYVCAQSLVQFNLASLSGKTIQSATLRLYVNYWGVGYYPRTWHVWANASSWNGSVTWNNVLSMLHYTDSVVEGISPPGSSGYWDVNVTPMVQYWASGFWNNYGFIFGVENYNWPYTTSYDAFAFYSNEDTGGGRPRLIVTYK